MNRSIAVLAAIPLLALAGCGTQGSSGSGDSGRLEVTAAFYPLQWASEQIGGDLVDVRPLTKPGAEPHDLELTPKDVAQMASSDVVVYLAGFQPAVDDAVTNEAKDAGFDVSPEADLSLAATAEEGHAEASGKDPHFWLDPIRYARRWPRRSEPSCFAASRPGQRHGTTRTGTNACRGQADRAGRQSYPHGPGPRARTPTSSPATSAFGYLAERYGLRPGGVGGRSHPPMWSRTQPHSKIIVARVKEHGVTRTVYSRDAGQPGPGRHHRPGDRCERQGARPRSRGSPSVSAGHGLLCDHEEPTSPPCVRGQDCR